MGICFGKKPNPGFENQRRTYLSPNTAGVTVDRDSTYYFRAYAVNDNGYALSKNYIVKIPPGKPAVAPCAPPNNTWYEGPYLKDTFPVVSISQASPEYGGNYRVIAKTTAPSSSELSIEFNRVRPMNGIYLTMNEAQRFSDHHIKNTVFVKVDGKPLHDDDERVYVAVKAGGGYSISFCNLGSSGSGGTFGTITGQFTFK
jgi:hypothetical protein